MARFAIIRQDGEIDVADGTSVADVSNRYGWPGNGNIKVYEGETPIRYEWSGEHGPAQQRADFERDNAARAAAAVAQQWRTFPAAKPAP